MDEKTVRELSAPLKEAHQQDVQAYGEERTKRALIALIAYIITRHWNLPREEEKNLVAGFELLTAELNKKIIPS
jgi:iron-sulfur cluster repair protein YtfE (RIC family)